MRWTRLLAVAALAIPSLAIPSLATAQGPAATGAIIVNGRDLNYEVSYTFNGSASAFTNANVLSRRFSGTFGVTTVVIAPSASGSLPGGNGDSFLTRFGYTYRTTFTGGGATGFSYQCGIDDTFISLVLNGTVVQGAGCDQYAVTNTFMVSGLVAGSNVLEFNGTGNGTTDGFAVRIGNVTMSPVPEPSAWALLGTGLVTLAGVARRRRTS